MSNLTLAQANKTVEGACIAGVEATGWVVG